VKLRPAGRNSPLVTVISGIELAAGLLDFTGDVLEHGLREAVTVNGEVQISAHVKVIYFI